MAEVNAEKSAKIKKTHVRRNPEEKFLLSNTRGSLYNIYRYIISALVA